jgi:flagella basal body P-ring formation protein FlgA
MPLNAMAQGLDSPLVQAVRHSIAPYVQADDQVTIQILNPLLANTVDDTWTYTTTLGPSWTPRFVMLARKANQQKGIPVQVMVQRKVFIPQAFIPAGTALAAQALTVAYKPLQTGTAWLSANTLLTPLQTRLACPAGQPIDSRKVCPITLVIVHQPVSVELMTDDGIALTVQGMAESSGQLGQRIPVLHGKKHFYGTVTGPHHVRVTL